MMATVFVLELRVDGRARRRGSEVARAGGRATAHAAPDGAGEARVAARPESRLRADVRFEVLNQDGRCVLTR